VNNDAIAFRMKPIHHLDRVAIRQGILVVTRRLVT
ncbi:uncharacterized protein METZ01_LOCUS111430, partial [marine metagenome]